MTLVQHIVFHLLPVVCNFLSDDLDIDPVIVKKLKYRQQNIEIYMCVVLVFYCYVIYFVL